jgi:hypothetical protein
MTNAEKINIILLLTVVVAGACGFIIGTRVGESSVATLPSNYNPMQADMAASLRACQETLTVVVRARETAVSH